MNETESHILRETHDSTIRQEEMLKNMDRRLADGDKKFATIDARFTAHDARLVAVEHEAGHARANRRRMGKVMAAVIGALMIPAAAWAWEHAVKWLSSGKVGGGP